MHSCGRAELAESFGLAVSRYASLKTPSVLASYDDARWVCRHICAHQRVVHECDPVSWRR